MPSRHSQATPRPAFYRQLFEAHPVPMWVYDLESLAFLAVNDAAVEHYGYSRDEFLGMTIAAIRPPEDVPALLDNVAHVTTGVGHAGVWRHRKRDGTIVDVELTSHVVDWAGRAAELVMAVDVTSRRRAEATLSASERRFALAFRTSPALMSLTRLSDRLLVDVSDSLARLTGFTREEMIGRTSAGLGIWADPEESVRIGEEIAGRGALLDRELHLRTRGGELRTVVAAFNLVEVDGNRCVLGTGIDITDRRAAEELVSRQKAQLEHLLASSPTTLYTLRLEGGALVPTFVSDNLQRVLGYTVEEVSHAGFFAWHVHPEDRASAVRATERLLADGRFVHEYRFRHRDGSYRWLRDEMRVTRREDGRPVEVTGSWSDVTDIHRVDEALRESEERFRLAFENAPIGMALVGLDERFLQVNQALCTILGRTREQLLAMTVPDVTHPDDVDAEQSAKEELREQRASSFAMEKRYVRPDGRVVLGRLSVSAVTDPSGRPLYFIGQLEDITESAEAARVLRERERRFRALIENAADAIALVGADGRIGYVSPPTSRMLGYSGEELIGQSALDLTHPADAEVVAARLAECVNAPGTMFSTHARVRHKNGTWRLLEGRFTNLLDDASVGAIVVNYRDVTEEKKLEEQLQQAQRLDSIGRLAGGVAHDFNNLLTAILGYTELLENGTSGAGDLDAIGEIRRAGERARELTQQLLTFARRQMISPRPIDLNHLLQRSRRLIDRLIGEQIVVETRLAEDLWDIEADAVQLEQVILNLAINARDAMPDGGRLTIETSNVELTAEDAAAHAEVTPGPHVALTVSDSGTGMPAETLASIFEPFFTTKPAGQGTGLGLATVYGIVRRAGGHVRVSSEVGRGTVFTLCFPRSTRPTQLATSAPASVPRGGGETLLLVEDDERVRTLTRRVLEGAGYRVLLAGDGRQALALAGQLEAPADLLVTDVVMPGMSGRQLAEALTALMPAMKVLYVSGYTQDAIGQRGVIDPGVQFLAKPFTPSALLAKVRDVLDG